MRSFVLMLVLLQLHATVKAQRVEGDLLYKKQTLSMPEAYKTPDGGIAPKNAKRAASGESSMWIVYSDRENNQTYLDKNCTKPFIKINFKQLFLVAEETDQQIRLVKFDPSSMPIDEAKKGVASFNKNAEDAGWVLKKNMLLWGNSLVDTATKYSKKAISVKKPSEAGDISQLIKKGILDLYDHPIPEKQYDNGKDIGLFKYLFVMKEDKENKTYLLSYVHRINQYDVDNNILGWARADQLHVWDNALCLRVNFDDAAIQERKDKGTEVKFFRTPEDARNFRDGLPHKPLTFLYNDPDEDRKENKSDNPYLLGFPIIDIVPGDNTVFKTGYVTNTVDRSGKSIFSANTQANFNRIYEDLQKKKQNVNLIFVLDGSYRNFFKSVYTALNNSAVIGSGVLGANQYKLGAVIYNDNACGEDKIKTIRKNANKEDFLDRLMEQQDYSPPCKIDRANNGAPIYEAIKRACAEFDDNSSTNIIIMTGSASDPDPALKLSALNELTKKQVMMYVYQVESKSGKLFDNFIRDSKYFLEETAKKIDENYFGEEIKSGKRKKAKLTCPGEYCELENSATPGAFLFKEAGQSFKPEEIRSKLVQLQQKIENRLNDLLARYDQNTIGTGKNAEAINEEEIKQLMMMLKDGKIADEDLQQLAEQGNFQIFIQAFTPLKQKKLTNPLLVRTLFMNREEFQNLVGVFEKLRMSMLPSQTRKELVLTYKEIITKYKGGNIDPNRLEGFNLDDFMKLVTKLPTNNTLFKEVKLSEIESEKKTPPEKIDKLRNSFNAIYDRLKNLKKKPEYRMEQDGEDFYWVPENVFYIEE